MATQVVVQYLLGVLPGPVDVVAPGDDNWKLQRGSTKYDLTFNNPPPFKKKQRR